jgi:hypothetical protein
VNGAEIPGAVRSAYTTPALTASDSGKTYDVMVSVAGRETPSSPATLTVVAGDPPAEQPYGGINFAGGGTSGGDALGAADVAGVFPQANRDNLHGFAFDPGTTPEALVDASGAATPVTLAGTLTEEWYGGTRRQATGISRRSAPCSWSGSCRSRAGLRRSPPRRAPEGSR